jgi:hypothetical protein
LGSGTLTGGGHLVVVLGSIGGAILVVLGVILVIFRVSHPKSSVKADSEMELGVPESLESAISANDWQTYLGGETENPFAPTIDPFCYTQDEVGF